MVSLSCKTIVRLKWRNVRNIFFLDVVSRDRVFTLLHEIELKELIMINLSN